MSAYRSAPASPRWAHALGAALLVSILLHWVVMDLLSGAGEPGTQRRALDVTLRHAAASAPSTPASPEPIAPKPAAERRREPEVDRPAPIAKAQQDLAPYDGRAPAPTARETLAARDASQALALPGLRSGAIEEARVAMRLALAAQQEFATLPLPARGATVWLEFDVSGRLAHVRTEPPTGEEAALRPVREAAARVAVPPALRGRAFTLDLMLERD